MKSPFYSMLTKIGLAKLSNATLTQNKVDFVYFAVGDGGGDYYEPDDTATALKNEVWRGHITVVEKDEKNPHWINIETYIPPEVGGFTIRELGIFDGNGNLLAIAKVAESYKPLMTEGSTKDLRLKMVLEISNDSVIVLKVDPSIIMASREYVDTRFEKLYDEHFYGVDGGDDSFSNYNKTALDGGDGNFSNLNVTVFDAGRY